MAAIPETTREAVRRAYRNVLGDQIREDTIAFEAAVMVYRHEHPETPEAVARDHVAQMIAEESMSCTGLDYADRRSG